jgi:hypothetical protein
MSDFIYIKQGFRLILFLLGILLIKTSCSKGDNQADEESNINNIYECNLNLDSMDFTFGIHYDNPEKYLTPGEQSGLSKENLIIIKNAIGTTKNNINDVLKVCHWINQNFSFENAGGGMAGVNTVNELFEIRTFYGCHSLALIISSVIRGLGIPTVMIETVDIQWAYDYRSGNTDYFAGHVMSEVYINDKWILLDNNCTYVEEYNYKNPYISTMNQKEKGLFVFAKGVDVWDYGGKNISYTHEKMVEFSNNLVCFEDLLFTEKYKWNN